MEREGFAILTTPLVMRVSTFVFITALMLCHLQVFPQTLISQFPSTAPGAPEAGTAQPSLATGDPDLPDAPDYPIAQVVPPPPSGVPVRFEYKQLEKHGSVYTLTGAVRIDYKNYILTADKVSFDQETSDAEADGHVRLEGKRNNELILADHGKLNFDLETGRFDNVTGSVGRQASASKRKMLYTTSNPFLFTGRYLIKEGPETLPGDPGDDDVMHAARSGLANPLSGDPGELWAGASAEQLLHTVPHSHSLPALRDPSYKHRG